MQPKLPHRLLTIISCASLVVFATAAQDDQPTSSPAPVVGASPTPSATEASSSESLSLAVATPEPNLPEIKNYPLDRQATFSGQPPSLKNGYTLDQLVQTALLKNTGILEQLAEIKRTRGVVIEVRAKALPDISTTYNGNETETSFNPHDVSSTTSSSSSSGSAVLNPQIVPSTVSLLGFSFNGSASLPGYTRSISQSASSFTTSISPPPVKSWDVSFQMQQALYEGGKIVAGIRQARILEDSAFFQLRDTVDQVIDSVRKEFDLVLLYRALIAVDQEAVALRQSQLTEQQHLFEAGVVPRFNVLRAEVALASAQPPLIQARNDYRTAQITLARLTGLSFPITTEPDPFPVQGILEYLPRQFDLDDSVESAKEHRAFLKVQRQTILADLEAVKIAFAGYQPQLTGHTGWDFEHDPKSNHLDDNLNGWFYGFNLGWDLWDSFATDGRAKQACAVLESAKASYTDAVRQVELEVETAFFDIIQSRETIQSQQKSVQQAEEALRLAQQRFDTGVGTQLDILDAQVALSQTRTTALLALSDYNSNLADYDRVTGRSTSYHETFDDPMTNPKIRKKWYSKKIHAHGIPLTDDQVLENFYHSHPQDRPPQGD